MSEDSLMSEELPSSASANSAGALLRNARLARGLELDTLAQLLKVPVRKLEALEADRHSELPGLAFVRSLAQTYSRQVGLDPAVVLAALPSSVVPPQQLEKVSRGLQTPYREVGGTTLARSGGAPDWLRPAYIVPALLLLALAFWFAPPMRSMFGSLGWPSPADGGSASSVSEALTPSAPASAVQDLKPVNIEPSSSVTVTPSLAVPAPAPASSEPVIDTVHSAPQPDVAASQADSPVAGPVVLRTTGDSWVEVRDARGKVLLSRTVPAGEVIGLDGQFPMKLRIGIAKSAQVTLRGEPVDLAPFTRGLIANVVLK